MKFDKKLIDVLKSNKFVISKCVCFVEKLIKERLSVINCGKILIKKLDEIINYKN